MSNTFIIIDGSSMLTTNYFATLPKSIMFEKDPEKKKTHYDEIMHTSDGTYTNAIYGTLKMLKKILEKQNPTHIAVVLDQTRNTFRRQMYADYKGTRSETQEPLKEQFILLEKLLPEMGIQTLYSADYEADDYAGTLATKFAAPETKVILVTKDHDYIQLVNDYTRIWMIQAKKEQAEALYEKYYYPYGITPETLNLPEKTFEFTPVTIKEEFGIEPKQIIDLKGISGDTSDNIPGIKGISDKTALPLIQEYGSLENLFDIVRDIDIEDKKEVKQINDFWKELGIRSPLKLLKKEGEMEGEKIAMLSKQLATIKCDIPISQSLDDFSTENFSKDKFNEICKRLEIKSI